MEQSQLKIEKIVVGEFQANCYIISAGKKSAIIDPGGSPELILNHVKKENLDTLYILNTHGHFDHICANYIKNFFEKQPMLGIHKDDSIYLSDDNLNLSKIIGVKCTYVSPDFFLCEKQRVKLTENVFLKVIHTPGHTPGSVCFKIENFLFSGDLLFFNGIGRTDLPGGNEKLLIKSLKKIFQIEKETIVLPGHGSETTIEYEIKTNPYLEFFYNDEK